MNDIELEKLKKQVLEGYQSVIDAFEHGKIMLAKANSEQEVIANAFIINREIHKIIGEK